MRRAMVWVMAAGISACSWVELTPQGEKVRLSSAAEVGNCRNMGQTTVSVLAKIAGLERHPEKVQEELNRLARNGAQDLHGDTVVPVTPVVEGKQSFAVYRCAP